MNRRQNDQINEGAKSPLGRVEQEIIALSKTMWDWMAERKVDALDGLFHEKAVFVHMGGSMTRKQELDTIRGGGIQYKKAEIKEKIVAGRIEKRLKEMCLLDQPYIKDQNITVGELVKQQVAALGENIQVRRFTRFILGDGIEVEESDFAAEVAAQVAGNA